MMVGYGSGTAAGAGTIREHGEFGKKSYKIVHDVTSLADAIRTLGHNRGREIHRSRLISRRNHIHGGLDHRNKPRKVRIGVVREPENVPRVRPRDILHGRQPLLPPQPGPVPAGVFHSVPRHEGHGSSRAAGDTPELRLRELLLQKISGDDPPQNGGVSVRRSGAEAAGSGGQPPAEPVLRGVFGACEGGLAAASIGVFSGTASAEPLRGE
ncbi:unnamed protein product [Cuscuta epithymum]|uniref:Uncharacterized protein n=1 Tax=Cuscuta epithymum TaxID=186058 RepID=A0AAV0FI58_9ASTE|nr:unnamed protein product [Cuscuta epithymum]